MVVHCQYKVHFERRGGPNFVAFATGRHCCLGLWRRSMELATVRPITPPGGGDGRTRQIGAASHPAARIIRNLMAAESRRIDAEIESATDINQLHLVSPRDTLGDRKQQKRW